MTSELKFITLDGQDHVVGFSEHTACGLVIPEGSSFFFDQPKSLHAACRHLIEDSDEYGVLKADIEADAPKTWNEGNLSSAAEDPAPSDAPDAAPVEAPTPVDTSKKASSKK